MANDGPIGVLDEILEPVTRAFSRDVAEALVKIRATPLVQQRISDLAEKCNEGRLTPEEQAQYESYVNALDFVSLLQLKARAWLAAHATL
jgi:F420-dependent methylenetetrahydromethanopterin dehydrogenase